MLNNVTFRKYRDLSEHPELVEKIDQLLEEVCQHDGVAAFSEAFVRGISEDQGHRHIVAVESAGESKDDVVGVLGLDPSSTVELAVSPSRRHCGVGRELLDRVITDFQLKGALEVWAHGDSSAAQKLVESVGGRRTRELLKMAVACEPGSSRREELECGAEEAQERIADQAVEILNYVAAVDKYGEELVDQEWVRVNNEAFAWHPEQGGWDLERLIEARNTAWFEPAGVWMLWVEDPVSEEPRCLGFHWTKIPVDQMEKPEGKRAGEVYVVCLADEARGRGLGGAITLLGIGYLLEHGAGLVELYVEGDNAPAVATYQHVGFEVVQTDVVYRGEKRE